jgi:hypothetical protein
MELIAKLQAPKLGYIVMQLVSFSFINRVFTGVRIVIVGKLYDWEKY